MSRGYRIYGWKGGRGKAGFSTKWSFWVTGARQKRRRGWSTTFQVCPITQKNVHGRLVGVRRPLLLTLYGTQPLRPDIYTRLGTTQNLSRNFRFFLFLLLLLFLLVYHSEATEIPADPYRDLHENQGCFAIRTHACFLAQKRQPQDMHARSPADDCYSFIERHIRRAACGYASPE